MSETPMDILFMRKYKFLILIVFFAATTAASVASNFYVRKGATGANNGSDWTNAWNELSQINFSTVACGDTVWIAGGTYTTGLKVNKTCTSSSVLNINRVLSSDSVPAAAAGWDAAYDSQVILPNISVPGPAAYITINGRKWQGGVEGSGGIQVLIPGSSGDGIDASNTGSTGPAIDHISWEYIEVYGPSCVTSGDCSGGGVVGVQIMPYCSTANRTNLLFDHLSIHRTGEAFRGCGWDSSTIQYSLIYDTNNDGQQHEDILYSNPPYQNVTWRYNKIFMSPNDGIFFEGGTGAVNWAFYGNVVYHSGGWLICFKSGSTYGPVYIYNNVFENDGTFGDYSPAFLGFDGMAGGEVANNVFENVTVSGESGAPPNANHNAYSISNASDGGSGSFSYSPGSLGASTMFVNESPNNPILADFHLTPMGQTTFAKGKALPAPYNMDPDGNTRGSDGNWYIGAYQTQGNTPAAPTNLTGVVH
jgi:hypothetical protein